MHRLHSALFVLSALVLQGCASMSQQECLMSDWHTVGFEDGARGAPAGTIGRYRESCADHGVAPDLQAYRAGREEGLRQFCTPYNGFQVGAAGQKYGGVCPPDLEGDFVEAHRAGSRLHDLQAAVAGSETQIRNKSNLLANLRKEMTAHEAALISDETTSERRVQLLAEIREFAKRQGELENEIVELEKRKAVQQNKLDRYQSQLAWNY